MQNAEAIQILQASTPEHFEQIRKLIREFVKWHLQRHLEDIELINEYFDSKGFEQNLYLYSLRGLISHPLVLPKLSVKQNLMLV